MKLRKKLSLIALTVLTSFGLVACGNTANPTNTNYSNPQQTTQQASLNNKPTNNNTNSNNSNNVSSNQLANLNYQSGHSAVINVNNDKSNLNPQSWKYDHVNYTNLDHENRTSTGNTAWLDSNNVANDSLRTRQIVKPTGYHQKFINNQAILNRGHEIAYSLSKGIDQKGQYNPNLESGDQNNPKNLFTQTAFSNQELQTIYESKVRDALRNGEHVIFQVKPIFQGTDLMAKGVEMQAISTDGSLNFNVYIFNVQPHVSFNYQNGTSVVNNNLNVPTPANAPHFNNDEEQGTEEYAHYLNPSMRYHHSHFLRHYLEYRLAKHMINNHFKNQYQRKMIRERKY